MIINRLPRCWAASDSMSNMRPISVSAVPRCASPAPFFQLVRARYFAQILDEKVQYPNAKPDHYLKKKHARVVLPPEVAGRHEILQRRREWKVRRTVCVCVLLRRKIEQERVFFF